MKKELRINRVRFFWVVVYFFCACNDPFIPKKKSYQRIMLPQKTYQKLDIKGFPYTFDYPQYYVFQKDLSFFGDKPDNPFWLNIHSDSLNATIYLTYKNLRHHRLDRLIFDSYKVTNKQIYKASSISDSIISSQRGYHMILYSVRGDAATTHQFYATDKKHHFLRGSLYLNATPNEDSMKLITDYIKSDIIRLLQTLEFQKP